MKISIYFFFSSQDTDPLIPDSLTSDVAFAASTNTAVDAIIDVLKYSQKDMDAAIELVKREVQWPFQSSTLHSLESPLCLDYLV